MHDIYLIDLEKRFSANIIIGNKDTILDNFSKDTRTINNNDIYIGIKGEKIDGSIYYLDALEKGAKGCIINDTVDISKEVKEKYSDRFIVTCKDTITLIQKMASYKRNLYDIPVIAITGSVGKTSTKDIVASVLSKKYNVLKTEGNYNNHIGVPLTILKLKDHNCLVLEMGMNHFGEISLLSHIAKPTVSIITNIGTAHIGILGSRENILSAKLEILDGLKNDGNVIINNDNDLLHNWYLEKKDKYNIVTYGIENESNIFGTDIILNDNNSEFKVNLNENEYDFNINIPGIHFVSNALCAISVGNLFNIEIDNIKKGIETFELTKKRMEIENINNITIINDSYNANYDSMKSAIDYLSNLNGRNIAVIGDMLELGDYTRDLHEKLGELIFNKKIDICILIGNYSKYIYDKLISLNYNKDNLYYFNNNIDAYNLIVNIINNNDNILFKASNSMNFTEIVDRLKTHLKE